MNIRGKKIKFLFMYGTKFNRQEHRFRRSVGKKAGKDLSGRLLFYMELTAFRMGEYRRKLSGRFI